MNRRSLARLLAAVALALPPGSPALPGAWPREPGASFLSLQSEHALGGRGRRTGAALYGEHGLTARITLGGQLYLSTDADRPARLTATARYALTGQAATDRLALSLGASVPLGDDADLRLEPALHWGRGFSSRLGPGWATASVRLLLESGEPPGTDLFGLAGIRPAPGWMGMLSASRYRDADGTYYRLSPSVGYQLRPSAWIVPSLTQEFGDQSTTRIGLALWLDF